MCRCLPHNRLLRDTFRLACAHACIASTRILITSSFIASFPSCIGFLFKRKKRISKFDVMSIGLSIPFYFSMDMQIEPLKAQDKMKTVLMYMHKSLNTHILTYVELQKCRGIYCKFMYVLNVLTVVLKMSRSLYSYSK